MVYTERQWCYTDNQREERNVIMPRVYVIQENRKIDISPAEEYGEIKVLLPSGDANYQAESTFDTLTQGLSQFNIREDYVLLTGDPTAIFMAGSILAELLFETTNDSGGVELNHVNVLKWNRRTNRYLSLKTPLIGE